MSSLSDFARGGAVGAGTRSTSGSPPGSPHAEASSSLLPTLPPLGSLGALGISGEDPSVLGGPMVTAGGVRSDSMATPRQLDGYMHGVEIDHE